MSGCFLKNDEFSLCDRHALSLEQQVAEILVAAAPPSCASLNVRPHPEQISFQFPRLRRTHRQHFELSMIAGRSL